MKTYSYRRTLITIVFMLLPLLLIWQGTIWLAPPSIKGMEDVGLGIYTTRDIQKHEFLSPAADGGLSIPVVDYMNGPRTRTRMNWLKTWNEYWWGRGK